MKDVVLALELSTVQGSVAVVAGKEVLFEASFEAKRSHNAQVFGPLGEALKVAGDRLRGIVVGTGPGSYTGVRIAIAATQGVALSRQVAVVGMSSLLGCVEEETFGVVGDARRGRFYLAQVRGGMLMEGIALLAPEALPRAMAETGLQRWITCDANSPVTGVEAKVPVAWRLAMLGCDVDFNAPQGRALEPIYLEGAFITQPRKK
jgi:tRNA threonylcarbamoyl adenosine modification protein YeaZ